MDSVENKPASSLVVSLGADRWWAMQSTRRGGPIAKDYTSSKSSYARRRIRVWQVAIDEITNKNRRSQDSGRWNGFYKKKKKKNALRGVKV